ARHRHRLCRGQRLPAAARRLRLSARPSPRAGVAGFARAPDSRGHQRGDAADREPGFVGKLTSANDDRTDRAKAWRKAMETLPRTTLSRAEMMKRVARFKELKGFDGGLPDSKMAGCERTLYNVIGFQPPKGEGGAVTSPVGDDASKLAAIKISEGFNLGYCRA